MNQICWTSIHISDKGGKDGWHGHPSFSRIGQAAIKLERRESRIVRIRLCGEHPVPILKMKQKRHWKTGRDGYGLKTLLTAGLRKECPDHGLNAEKRKQTIC